MNIKNYQEIDELKNDLNNFLIFYTFNREWSNIIPFNAVDNLFKNEPKKFKVSIDEFQDYIFKMMKPEEMRDGERWGTGERNRTITFT